MTPVDGHGGKGRFVENLGQWGDHVRFVATGAMGEVAFHDDGAMYILKEDGADRAVKVSFHGATNVIPVGVGDTGARHNYLIGDDPDGWVVGAREFEAMEYQNVWEGIDVRYYFTDLGFKYDVVVGQDADPSSVRFDVDGHTGLEVGIDQMTISVGEGTLLDRDLVAWYEGGEAVEASFRPTGDGYGFSVDKTPGRTLIIDPLVITRSTFLGGTYEDLGADLTMDDEGNVYVAGSSVSTDYPVTPGVHNETNQGDDLVITKMDRDLSTIIWSTYIGGTSKELMTSIALDEEGNVHALGTTESDDFPVTPGALQNARGGPYRSDLFILKLSSDGSSLVYATYMGGMSIEIPGDIEVHDGRAYVAASTESKDFPIGDISGWRYSSAPFVLIISEDGTKLEAFQYWNVTRMVEPFSMHVGEDGTVTLTGRTSSPDLPTTPGAYVEEAIWPMASFVIQCDPWTNETSLCTYFGATGVYASEVALDAEGNIYLAGLAYSFNQGLPLTEGAWCSTFKGTRDEFLAKMDPNGSRVEYCTLVGGDNYDFAGDLDVTDDGNAIFVGWSWKAENLNTTGNAHDDENEGAYEGFVVVLDKEGGSPVQSTYLGDQFGDYITSVYVTPEGTLLLSGYTESKKFPVTEGAYQEELAGDRDIFITELAVLSPPSAPLNLTA
ncbi:MAG: SBBP repeat-containing protein, partial [Thermoplasmata archaeon]